MAKLSSRERKAQKAGGTLNYKTGKISVKKAQPRSLVSKNGINKNGGTNGFIGPVVPATMYGPTKPGSTVQPGYYNAATGGATPVKSKSKQSNKSKSNRSLLSKSMGLLGVNTANASSGEESQNKAPSIDYNKVSLTPGKTRSTAGTLFKQGTSILEKAVPGLGIVSKGIQGLGFDASKSLGLDKTIFQRPTGLAQYTDDQTGRVLGVSDQQSMYDFGKEQETDPYADPNEFVAGRNKRSDGFQISDLFRTPTAVAAEKRDRSVPDYTDDYEKTLRDEMSTKNDYLNLANSQPTRVEEDPANVKLEDNPFGTQRPASGRGSGLFGTGKGVGNPAGPEDEYIRELRKSLKGYGSQEDDVMRQFKNLIKALDPTYDEYEKEAKDELGRALWNNNTQLASVMNANNVGDSEQRAQLLAGQQRDNQSQLGDLLRKLMLQKNEDIQGYKTKGVEAVNSIRDKEMSARERIAQLIRQAQVDNMAPTQSAGRGRSALADTGLGRDVAFEKEAKKLQQQILMGRINRDAAAKSLSSAFPDYDENVIYDLVPDNYNR